MTALGSAWRRFWNVALWPWRRLPLAVRVLLWIPIGVELLYLVAANAFLNFNVLPLAFASTNQVKATVGGGWTIIPQRVHVHDVRLIFQDHNLEFSIDLARGFMVVRLSDLLKHEFHASHLRAEGVAFRMRNRVDPWTKNDPDVANFPPIPEFPSPAVVEAWVRPPQIPDAEYNLWTVYFDDVDVGTTELWVQAFRYRGHGRARGQFALKPARKLWVGPASLDLDPGLLSAGAYRVAPGLHGHVDVIVHPFDPRPPVGLEPLRWVSAHVRLDAPTLDPQVYTMFAGEPAAQVTSNSGTLHLELEMRRGIISSGARLDLVQNGVELRTVQGDLSSDRIELHAGTPGESGSQATLLIERGVVKEPIAPGFPPHIEHLDATVMSDNRDATKEFQFKEARVNDARFTLRDANWLNRWLKGGGFSLAGGGASVSARGSYADGLVDADTVIETDGLAARLGAKHFHYEGGISAHLSGVDPQRSTGAVLVDLTGRSMRADLGQGEINLAGMQVHVSAHRDASSSALHGEAKLFAFSSRSTGVDVHAPELKLVADSEQTSDGTQITQFSAVVPALTAEGRGARLTTAATARGTFAQPKNNREQRLDVTATLSKPLATFTNEAIQRAAAPRVEVTAKLATDAQGALSGKVTLMPADWHVDAQNMRFSGRSALGLELATLNVAQHSGSLTARLNSTGVTLGDTKQNAECPWSRVQQLQMDAHAELAQGDNTTVTVNGQFGQTELNWGDFTTRADIGLAAKLEQRVSGRDGDGTMNLSFRNASLQSGTGSRKEGWAARMGELDVEARLAQRDGKLTGTALVKAEGARGRIGETLVNGDLEADLKLDALDLVARTAHSSGAVRVRNASLPSVSDPVSKWWADVKLDSLYGHAGENLELGGTFRASLRDATPGLAVLAEQGSLPKWVASAFPLRDLSVTGSLARRCRLTDIHLVELKGGPALARGRLQSVPNGFQGALLLRVAGFSVVSAGLDFDANHTHIGLFDGDSWLEKWSQSFDRQSDAAVKLVCPPDPNLCTDPNAKDTPASEANAQ